MSLPDEYSDPSHYFNDALEFLNKFAWIYKTANTNFLKEKVFDNFPDEWKHYFSTISSEDLSLFPDNMNKISPPKSLQSFQNKIAKLKPKLHQMLEPVITHNIKVNKINVKKSHEIAKLSNTILEACGNKIDILIDFGSGLGYLCELLHKLNMNINIIGLESDSARVASAKKRLDEYYPTAKGKVFFVQHLIQEDSLEFIEKQTNLFYPQISNPTMAIVGLHSCADLAVMSINMFFEKPKIKNLIIMPCCYHKLELIQDNGSSSGFKNFPLSSFLKESVEQFGCAEILNRPFLRLACQQTAARWREMIQVDHILHGREMFLRGVVEIARRKEEIVSKKKNCKINENSVSEVDLETIKSLYEVKRKSDKKVISEWTEEAEDQIKDVLTKYPNGPMLAEALYCLQTSLQGICENLVLYDRICYMREKAENKNMPIECKFEKILDEKLSPRCFVLIAQKYVP